MFTSPKTTDRHRAVVFWSALVASVVFGGFYIFIRLASVLNPPDGWERVSAEQRYVAAIQQLRTVLDLLPVAAFIFAILAYFVWRQPRDRMD